jgi:hypothetical protein
MTNPAHAVRGAFTVAPDAATASPYLQFAPAAEVSTDLAQLAGLLVLMRDNRAAYARAAEATDRLLGAM